MVEGSETIKAVIENVVKITKQTSDLLGVNVNIPVNALQTDSQITIGKISNPPSLDEKLGISFGIPCDFGPDGIKFAVPVTISIPHSAETDHGGIIKVYYYDIKISSLWSINVNKLRHGIPLPMTIYLS